ncbi:hypothetical protein VTO73DRAFT_4499 [Trametes versicolor]
MSGCSSFQIPIRHMRPNAFAADVDTTIKILLKQAHDAARKNASVPVTSADIRSELLLEMYFPATWADLANTTFPEITAAVQGEALARTTLGVAQRIVLRHKLDEAEAYGGIAIACSDSVDLRGPQRRMCSRTRLPRPRAPAALIFSLPVWSISWNHCRVWPMRAVARYTGPLNKKPVNEILMANNRVSVPSEPPPPGEFADERDQLDAATPLEGAQALTKIIGDNAALVVQEGIGLSRCINEILFTYMTTGAVPDSNNTTCEVDFQLFDGVNSEAILAALTAYPYYYANVFQCAAMRA